MDREVSGYERRVAEEEVERRVRRRRGKSPPTGRIRVEIVELDRVGQARRGRRRQQSIQREKRREGARVNHAPPRAADGVQNRRVDEGEAGLGYVVGESGQEGLVVVVVLSQFSALFSGRCSRQLRYGECHRNFGRDGLRFGSN